MNIRILFLSLTFLFSNSYATTYCVDPANIGDVGCDDVLQTIEEVNMLDSTQLLPGDSVLFKRGEVWRESLIVPSSGSSNSSITFGVYGSVALPLPEITGTRLITDQLWQGILPNGGFDEPALVPNCVSSPDRDHGIPGWIIGSTKGHECAIEEEDGGKIFRVKNLSGGNTDVVNVDISMQAGVRYRLEGRIRADSNSSIHVYLHSSNPAEQYLSATVTVLPEETDGVWVSGSAKEFLITDYSDTRRDTNGWVNFSIPFAGIDSQRMQFRVSVRPSNGAVWFDDIKLIDEDNNYWSVNPLQDNGDPISNVIAPRIFVENGVRLAQGVTEWDPNARWSRSSKLIIRYRPPTGISEPGNINEPKRIEIGQRRLGVLLKSRDYIILNDLMITGTEGFQDSLETGAGILLSSGSSNNLVQRVELYNNDYGIRVQGAKGTIGVGGPDDINLSTDNIFTGFIIANSRSMGISLRNYASRNTISNCNIHDITMFAMDEDGADKEAVGIGGNTGNGTGNVLENCEIYNIGINTIGMGSVEIFNSPGTIVRNNYIYDVGYHGIGAGANAASPHGYRTDDVLIEGNVVQRSGIAPLGSQGQGIGISVHGVDMDGVTIRNNTILDCEMADTKDGGISLRGVASDGAVNTIRNVAVTNNIVSNCHAYDYPVGTAPPWYPTGGYPHALFVGSSLIVEVENLVIEHNLYDAPQDINPDSPFISFKGQDYTLSEFEKYQNDTGFDAHSLLGDPLFVNAAIGDAHLTSGSPAINAGIDVGQTGDFDGNPIVGIPDIGAFEFQDYDGDGFEVSVDCNDNDASIYLGATEIPYDGIDQDCSGSDLTDVDSDGQDAVVVGGTDCNDSDTTIYLGATEVPYDGIDQSCSGSDLTDVDNDGFDAEIVAGGTDCNDNDPTFNPTAIEIINDGADNKTCDADSDFTVTITEATLSKSGALLIKAVSSRNEVANLTVDNYGVMTWETSKRKGSWWEFSKKKVASAPGTITVRSLDADGFVEHAITAR